MKTAVVALSTLAIASAAMATPIPPKTYTGTGGPIADAGSNPTTTSFSIVVPPEDDVEILNMVNVSLNIAHTFVGDLIIRLTHVPSGTFATLIDRPGVPPGTFGNGDDLNGIYVFEDFQPLIPEVVGAPGGVIPPGTYGPSGPGFLFAFEGVFKGGQWRLDIVDNAGGDTGTLHGWSMTMTNVPAPSALALLGLGGLVAGRRRR